MIIDQLSKCPKYQSTLNKSIRYVLVMEILEEDVSPKLQKD